MLKVNNKEITHSNKKYIQDNDCHWYIIHKEDQDLFLNLLEKAEFEDYFWEATDEFEKRFDNWMTGWSMDLLDEKIEK